LRAPEAPGSTVARFSAPPRDLAGTWAAMQAVVRAADPLAGAVHATVGRGVVRGVLPAAAPEAIESAIGDSPFGGTRIFERLPAALWPGKVDAVASLSTAGLDFESPFGAISIITSSVGNFGYVGGLAFVGVVGMVFGWAERNATSPVMRALYCFLVSLLLFLFFRDPFQVQVKLVTTGFLLVALHWATTISVTRRGRLPRLAPGR
jgi:uncharacterized membrane protein